MNRTDYTITIPSRTYPSVPCEIIHAGLKVGFEPVEGKTIKGAYELKGSNVWDSALSFTHNMYKPGTHMCVSFTGPYKHFKLSKQITIVLKNSTRFVLYFFFTDFINQQVLNHT